MPKTPVYTPVACESCTAKMRLVDDWTVVCDPCDTRIALEHERDEAAEAKRRAAAEAERIAAEAELDSLVTERNALAEQRTFLTAMMQPSRDRSPRAIVTLGLMTVVSALVWWANGWPTAAAVCFAGGAALTVYVGIREHNAAIEGALEAGRQREGVATELRQIEARIADVRHVLEVR